MNLICSISVCFTVKMSLGSVNICQGSEYENLAGFSFAQSVLNKAVAANISVVFTTYASCELFKLNKWKDVSQSNIIRLFKYSTVF